MKNTMPLLPRSLVRFAAMMCVALWLLATLPAPAARPIARLDEPARPIAEAPVLDWGGVVDGATGGYAIELSTTDFETVFYNSYRASGRMIATHDWRLPRALWRHLPDGTVVQWRVVGMAPSGATQFSSSRSSFIVGDGTASPRSNVSLNFDAAAKVEAAPADAAFVPEEILVQVPAAHADAFIGAMEDEAFAVSRVETLAQRTLVRLNTAPGADVTATVAAAQNVMGQIVGATAAPGVDVETTALVQPNFVYRAQLTPTDPHIAGIPRLQYAPQMIRANDAWTQGITGAGVVVAVVDTGLNTGSNASFPVHQEFSAPGKAIYGANFHNDTADPTDDNSHGMHVAGIISSAADGVGMVGVAPESIVMGIRSLGTTGSGSSFSVAQGIDYATITGARVINMSLGSVSFTSPFGFDGITESAIANALDHGVVVVAAAGNDRSSIPSLPGSMSDIIVVGAINEGRTLTQFSNNGPWISVVAPGNRIYSLLNTSSTGYSFKSGTSQAAPVVAGAVALILQAHPALTPRQVKELLMESAEDLGPSGRDNFFGAGLINVAAALGITPGVDQTPPAMTAIEFTTTGFTMTFSQNMLMDNSTNAANRTANWLLTPGISGAAPLGLSTTPNSISVTTTGALTVGSTEAVLLLSNVRGANGIPVVCNRDDIFSTARQNLVGSSVVDISAAQTYAQVVASSNGQMQLIFRNPMVSATVTNKANYTLVHGPTNTSGTTPTGGTAVDLSPGIVTVSYDSASRTATFTGLPAPMTTPGTTFALTLGAGLQEALRNNPISTSTLRPVYGVVTAPNSEAVTLLSVSNNLLSNNRRESLALTFSKALRTDSSLYNPANYSVILNGSPLANPADLDIQYVAGTRQVALHGYDFALANGQTVQITVSGIFDVDGLPINPSANSASSMISTTSSNFAPRYRTITANTTSLLVRFDSMQKMNAANVVVPGNWTLESDASNPPTTPVSLAGATFTYDSTRNTLLIDGLSLTAGHFFRLTAGTNITKRYTSSFNIAAGGGGAEVYVDVVGGSTNTAPDAPTSVQILPSGLQSAPNVVNLKNQAAPVIEVAVPASTPAGTTLDVTVFDSSVPRNLLSASVPMATGGAATYEITSLNLSGFALGNLGVQAIIRRTAADRSHSDPVGVTAEKTSDLPVEISNFTLY